MGHFLVDFLVDDSTVESDPFTVCMQQVGSDQDGIGGGYADHYRRMLQREREEENKTLFRRMKK